MLSENPLTGFRHWDPAELSRMVEFAGDSPLEEAGFEPSFPLRTLRVVVVSALARAAFR